jgi:HlyD family secretion protein
MTIPSQAGYRWRRGAGWAIRALVVVAVVAAGYLLFNLPVAVHSHPVSSGPIMAEVMGTGTLEARTKVTISPKIAGRVFEVLVDQGDRVKAGQLLVRLDDEELEQQVQIAESNIEFAKASMGRFKADREQAASILVQATSDHERSQQLLLSNSISRADADKAREAWDVAKAGVARAAAADVEAQQQILSALRTLAFHQARLADCELVAPFDGLILERFRDPGAIAVPGTSLLSMVSTDELWISAWVDESRMAALAEGQTARVVFRSEPDRPYQGEIARLGRQADRETREFVIDVRVLDLPQNWAIGQRAEVYVRVAEQADAVLVPQEFLAKRAGQDGVYIRQQGRAFWQPITVGLTSRTMVEAVDGLEVGAELVVPLERGQVLTDSRRVTVE